MTIERMSAVPGMCRPQYDGKDVYAQVVVSDRPRMVFIAGQLSRDANGKVVGAGDMAAQMRQVGENLKLALAAVGAELSDVAHTCTYVTSLAAFSRPDVLAVRHEYLGAFLPTSTTVEVSALAGPGLMIEINAIAMLSPSQGSENPAARGPAVASA
jgi:2-iminobutanoate/2-iminopropanoate deaminase